MIIEIDFRGLRHYWTGFSIHFNWGRSTSYVKVEKYYDADGWKNGGGCTQANGAKWVTIYENSNIPPKTYNINIPHTTSFLCKLRITLGGTPAYSEGVRIGEIRGYQYYYGDQGLYTKRTGDRIFGSLTIDSDLNVGGKVKGSELCIGNDCKARWGDLQRCQIPDDSINSIRFKVTSNTIHGDDLFLPPEKIRIYTTKYFFVDDTLTVYSGIGNCPFEINENQKISTADGSEFGDTTFQSPTYMNVMYGKKPLIGGTAAIDGDPATAFRPWSPTPPKTVWSIDLGRVYYVKRLDIKYGLRDDGEAKSTVKFYYSNDGNNWILFHSYALPCYDCDMSVTKTIRIEDISFRYLRVEFGDNSPGLAGDLLYLYEIVAWGT